MLRRKKFTIFAVFMAAMLILGSIAAPMIGAEGRVTPDNKLLSRLSQGVVFRYWLANPDQAPAFYQDHLKSLNQKLITSQAPVHTGSGNVRTGNLFNLDDIGFPQNEESVTYCPNNVNTVLGGTNDYRGLLDPEGNFTGWHLSLDGGQSVTNEGLLPTAEIGGNPVPSGGDPVVVAVKGKPDEDEKSNNAGKPEDGCLLYAGSLNYDPTDPFGQPSGVGVYRSDPDTLASCPGGSDASCWPIRKIGHKQTFPTFWTRNGST